MIVCHCFAVSDRVITSAVADGATTVAELSQQCRAGSDCGGCHRRLEQLLATAYRLLDAAAA